MRWLRAWSGRADAAAAHDATQGDTAIRYRPCVAGLCGRGVGVVGLLTSLIVLGGCETSTKLGDVFKADSSDDPQTTATLANEPDETTGSFAADPRGLPAPGLLGGDAYDDLNLGKKFFRLADYGLAELHFRRAVESYPRDGEAWIGLAACYDQLRRFELADRAYLEVIKIAGKTSEVLNNQGYSYILRRDYRRARQTLLQARAMDPSNRYVQNNLALLAKATRKRKSIDN
jgi:tetratricopeptide (TPR) repeat protein